MKLYPIHFHVSLQIFKGPSHNFIYLSQVFKFKVYSNFDPKILENCPNYLERLVLTRYDVSEVQRPLKTPTIQDCVLGSQLRINAPKLVSYLSVVCLVIHMKVTFRGLQVGYKYYLGIVCGRYMTFYHLLFHSSFFSDVFTIKV